MLTGKKILVAVTGSIAAYKTAFFVRLLVKEGAEVKVVMTSAAKNFISPLTLATLSKNPVESEYFDEPTGVWTNHVDLALWADVMVIAPLSANTLAKLANGLCDNLLCATYLSAKCPVFFAPAMDLDMFRHPATQSNLKRLQHFGNTLIDAEEGELASGLHGKGRMAEPETMLNELKKHFSHKALLAGKKVLITSGPTQEAIDPVRFIGNHSSGKMGKAMAEAFAQAGSEVTFVTGPAKHLLQPSQNIKIEAVESANEMYEAAKKHHDQSDVVVFSAAVADYRPEKSADTKIKKEDTKEVTIKLVANPDIAAELGKRKSTQFHVGFALETHDAAENARKKLAAKNFDMIILNSLEDKGAGFAHDTNKVSIFDKDNNALHTELITKNQVAQKIVDLIADNIS